jgi:hypothetical protein
MTLLRLNNAVERERQVAIYDPSRNQVVKVPVNPDDLVKVITEPPVDAEEILEKYEKLREKQILTKFMVVREFLSNPIRVEQRSREQYYAEDKIRETLNKLATLLMWLRKNKTKYNVPLNPDMWTKEHELQLAQAIEDLCTVQGYVTDVKKLACKASFMGALRRIKRFYDMQLFQGMQGRVIKRVMPRQEFMSLDQYRQLYKLYTESDNNDYRAWFEIMTLHLLTGAREGYGSIKRKLVNEMAKV